MRKFRPLLHPFLFSSYAVLALLAFNIGQINPVEATRSLIVTIICATILLLLNRLLIKDWDRAGMLTSLLLILFFSYGHVYHLLKGISLGEYVIGRHRYLIGFWLAISITGGCWIWRKLRKPSQVTPLLNIIAAIAIVQPLFTIISYHFRSNVRAPEGFAQQATFDEATQSLNPEQLPDVYHIIMDAYARQDVLQDLYHYDNSPFINYLTATGFFVASNSHSNYAQTTLSLSSTLNLNYIEAIVGPLDPNETDKRLLTAAIEHSLLRQILERLGYTTISFSTTHNETEIRDADIFLEPNYQALQTLNTFGAINLFEGMLIQTSAGVLLRDFIHLIPNTLQSDLDYPFQEHRERILFTFEHLADLPPTAGPKLVLVHIVSPHIPFVFGPNGEKVPQTDAYTLKGSAFLGDRETYIQYYTDQLTYLNRLLQETIDAILEASDIPPIIILQSDHGPGGSTVGSDPSPISYRDERMSILNAYYLPGCDSGSLYDEITPVNTFRVVLNLCFGADYELLEDLSFMSNYKYPYDLNNVTDQLR